MDISMNMIDLEYLMNPVFANLHVKAEKDETFNADKEFYKKRIFKLTKDMLRDASINAEVDKAFIEYAKICINYFKFIDKSDIIQKQYGEKRKVSKKPPANVAIPDHLFMRKTPAIQRTIPECIPVKVTNEKKKILFLPKPHNINLRNSEFRTKGLRKKNEHNKYGKNKKKNKKNRE